MTLTFSGESVKETVWYYSGIFHTYGQSYHCNGTTTVNVSNFVEIDVSQLQYRAFGVTHDDDFSDKGKYTVIFSMQGQHSAERFFIKIQIRLYQELLRYTLPVQIYSLLRTPQCSFLTLKVPNKN